MKVHFIGIGGISMSALAEICLDKGYTVSGSDIQDSYLLEKLRQKGATIYLEQKKENIKDDVEMIIHTAAVDEENPEMAEALRKKKILFSRAAFLGQLMREYENTIAIAGTHGKTTTTSLLGTIFEYSKLDPTILVGGNLSMIGGNVKIGSSSHFIAEACEYTDSFLNFNPKIGIVLNVDKDHLDYFSGIEEIISSFNKFGKKLPKKGYFIINGDDNNTKNITYGVKAKVLKFGKGNNNDAIIKNIKFDKEGYPIFDLTYDDKSFGTFKLAVKGTHNIYNATASIIASYLSGIEIETIRKNIIKYIGVGRRFETKGTYNEALIMDDYAHHPNEIKATLSAAKDLNKNKIYAIFQPHTYSRTKLLLNEFSDSFNNADKVIITDIYAAREDNPGDISSQDLVDKIKSKNIDAIYIKEFDEIVKYLKENVKPNDLVITLGAGTIYKVAEEIVK